MSKLPPELLVSFWDIALGNFSEGNFRHGKLLRDEAVQLINGVKRNGKVFFGRDTDIGAPYNKKELQKTKDLTDILAEHHGINITIDDFFTKEETGVFSLPITMFDIRPDRPLLIVTCRYALDGAFTKDRMGFSLAPDTVGFHLFEMEVKAAS